MFWLKTLKSCSIALIIALNAMNCFCDMSADESRNKTIAKQLTHNSVHNSKLSSIHITNAFLYRTLFVVLVISMSLSLVCIIRMYYSNKRLKRLKTRGMKDSPKYDFLPTKAINDSIDKNAFVLIDSDDEDLTLFDSSRRLIK